MTAIKLDSGHRPTNGSMDLVRPVAAIREVATYLTTIDVFIIDDNVSRSG